MMGETKQGKREERGKRSMQQGASNTSKLTALCGSGLGAGGTRRSAVHAAVWMV
jgi:hypothetical protein